MPIWRSMVQGLIRGNGDLPRPLITVHPPGGNCSSLFFNNEPWLDFHMWQTAHERYVQTYQFIESTYNLQPARPVIDGEAMYEEVAVCIDVRQGFSVSADIRRAAYWNVFSGAAGHTYGCNAVWQMYDYRKPSIAGPALRPWFQSLDLPGAQAMTHLRTLMESRPYFSRIPDQTLFASWPLMGLDHIVGTRGDEYLFVYSPAGKDFSLNMEKISGEKLNGFWYNPRTGESTPIGLVPNKEIQKFVPPTNGWENDWVLILDDETRGYGPPHSQFAGD
jgi:hypothetical protein